MPCAAVQRPRRRMWKAASHRCCGIGRCCGRNGAFVAAARRARPSHPAAATLPQRSEAMEAASAGPATERGAARILPGDGRTQRARSGESPRACRRSRARRPGNAQRRTRGPARHRRPAAAARRALAGWSEGVLFLAAERGAAPDLAEAAAAGARPPRGRIGPEGGLRASRTLTPPAPAHFVVPAALGLRDPPRPDRRRRRAGRPDGSSRRLETRAGADCHARPENARAPPRMSSPGEADPNSHHPCARLRCLVRRRRQPPAPVAHRHRAREARLPPAGSFPPTRPGPRSLRLCSKALAKRGRSRSSIWAADRPQRGGASTSLGNRGQLELSGAPLPDLHATRAELAEHFAEVRAVAELWASASPLSDPIRLPVARRCRGCRRRAGRHHARLDAAGGALWPRHDAAHLHRAGPDFESESDMAEKFRLSSRCSRWPLPCSPPVLLAGRPSGYLSLRARAWTGTDAARTGIPACVFEPGFGFERYAEFVLDVPMYFVMREGRLRDATGATFRDFLAGRHPKLAGVAPTIGDFADHVTTVFTDVRLKRYLEMRGSDAGDARMLLAEPALWVGLLWPTTRRRRRRPRWCATGERRKWRPCAPRCRGWPWPPASAAARCRRSAREVVAIARTGCAPAAWGKNLSRPAGRDCRRPASPRPNAGCSGLEREWGGDVRPALAAAAVVLGAGVKSRAGQEPCWHALLSGAAVAVAGLACLPRRGDGLATPPPCRGRRAPASRRCSGGVSGRSFAGNRPSEANLCPATPNGVRKRMRLATFADAWRGPRLGA